MSNELVINSARSRIALLRNKSLVELHQENNDEKFVVGDIFLGSIRKLVPGLNAAFVDVGYEKDAFLHYLDLGPQIRSLLKFIKQIDANRHNAAFIRLSDFQLEEDIDKHGKITDIFKQDMRVLVQVVKEPISTKGPRLTCELSLAGRYLVLQPFSDVISVSKKITDNAEKNRLKKLVASIKPKNFGVIVRTVAEGKNVEELDKDLRELLEKWEKGMATLPNARPRQKIIGEMNRANSILRDMLNESFDSITVDDETVYQEIKEYIQSIAPDKVDIVKLYTGKAKIFEAFGIEKQMKTLFGQTVSLPSGGYLIIEHTEAMHVIDVNSGNKSNSEIDQEATALSVNLEACAEIARQLRLRDMGGIIVVDFIDMREKSNKDAVYERMKEEMASDRAKHTILKLSKFGIMEITRQRVRPEVVVSTKEVCPTCNGTGKISASIAISDRIESDLDYLLGKQNEKIVSLCVHPYLYAYFTTGLISRR
ncbi:MAG: Rne/Rng family ribonuclease, partial [Flammeovirgaceae bacterium]|nr:Rne/Rng family ribonuclease [Flammeovirgaceae bacterium]